MIHKKKEKEKEAPFASFHWLMTGSALCTADPEAHRWDRPSNGIPFHRNHESILLHLDSQHVQSPTLDDVFLCLAGRLCRCEVVAAWTGRASG